MSTEETPEEQQVDYNKGYFAMPRELRAACAQVHKNTAQLVEFIAEQTFGWHSRWVYLTYDEIKSGRKKQNGERMGPGSFLTRDAPIRRAIVDALNEERPLIEVRYLYGQTAYAIHSNFWASSKLIPRWEFFKRTSYSPYDDPIPYEQATTKLVEDEQREARTDTHDAKISTILVATDYQIDSRQLPNSEEATSKKVEGMGQQDRPEAARRGPINTSLDTSSKDLNIDTFGASAHASRPDGYGKTEKEVKTEETDPPSPSVPASPIMQITPDAEDRGAGAATVEVGEASERQKRLSVIAGELLYWREGMKVIKMAQLPKWRGSFKWEIEAEIARLEVERAELEGENA